MQLFGACELLVEGRVLVEGTYEAAACPSGGLARWGGGVRGGGVMGQQCMTTRDYT